MGIRASDIEATAIGQSALLAAQLKDHRKTCYQCDHAFKGKQSANACAEGWRMVLEIRQLNQRIDKIRADRAARQGSQAKLI